MIQILDDVVSPELLEELREVVRVDGTYKDDTQWDHMFSWLSPTEHASIHSKEIKNTVKGYVYEILLPLISCLVPDQAGVEWWCNTNTGLPWHVDKDEMYYEDSGTYSLPALSTVFYPHTSCSGGELLVADNTPVENGFVGGDPKFRRVVTIPPATNRLVLMSPGILHRINPIEGERYSLAVNFWNQKPVTSQRLPF